MNTIYSNIYSVLNLSTDDQFDNGLSWYDDAREFCKMVSNETNRPLISVCAALAALSPRNKWERNKQDCYELCKNNSSHKFGTFHAMVNKARKVLEMNSYADIIDELNGPKICAFFDNIFNPDSQLITVDFHMLHIALGQVFPEDERPSLTKSLYDDIAWAIKLIADNNKLRPYEAQAILWLTWRDLV